MRYTHSKLVVETRGKARWRARGWSLHHDGTYTVYTEHDLNTEELATLIDVLTENSENVEIECPFEYAGP